MAPSAIFQEYLNFLWTIFQQDMANMANWWMWAFLAIPGIFYLVFFVIRWAVITLPLWLPGMLVLSGMKAMVNVKGFGKKEC